MDQKITISKQPDSTVAAFRPGVGQFALFEGRHTVLILNVKLNTCEFIILAIEGETQYEPMWKLERPRSFLEPFNGTIVVTQT